MPIIFPNALRSYSVPIFLLVGVFSAIVSYKSIGKVPITIYVTMALTTVIFLLVGTSAAYADALLWILFVYIVSPLLWMFFWNRVLERSEIYQVVNILKIYTLLACLSIFIFMYVFINYGSEYVGMLIDEPNVEFSQGRIGVAMHVLGSLIFLGTGFLAVPNLINKWLRIPLIIILTAAALSSGRSALILAAGIGIFINFARMSVIEKARFAMGSIFVISLIGIFLTVLSSFSEDEIPIDVFEILLNFLNKVIQGGGDERVMQLSSLIDGIIESNFLGVGHGVSALVVRNEINPWKYELLWVSTVFHVGLIGFFIYAIPVLLVGLTFINLKRLKKHNDYDVFVMAGFVSILLASNTNPYLQSFDFQWMFVFPCVYFYKRYRAELR
ncbi:hypothetical protein L63ED372_00122 [Limnohabitans sp. 63ED37-2]|nr:hypothetical protein L63ED372_00122 [Limnohabitans sp. 63ED37-2]